MSESRRERAVFSSVAARRSRRLSVLADRLCAWLVAAGGLGVLAALLGIAAFLIGEVMPLFSAASMTSAGEFALPDQQSGGSVFVGVGPQSERGLRVSSDGTVVWFSLRDGELMGRDLIALPAGVHINRVARAADSSELLALALSDGSVLAVQLKFGSAAGQRDSSATLTVSYPLGGRPRLLGLGGPLAMVALRRIGDEYLVLGSSAEGIRGLLLKPVPGGAEIGGRWTAQELAVGGLPMARQALISAQGRYLYLLDDQGWLRAFRREGVELRPAPAPRQPAGGIQAIALLDGDESIIAFGADGTAALWFMVRAEGAAPQQARLTLIRRFDTGDGTLVHWLTEHRRRGFMTVDAAGHVSLFYSTASRPLLRRPLTDRQVVRLALSPRGDRLLLESEGGQMSVWTVRNDHPEVSWQSLWGRVWYESYPEPAYVWQSSAATSDFEPKLSLMPLIFGTLKAAGYALLLATPLAIGGAAYTAYFMAPGVRRLVKPLVELMEALPTVIIGLLAGIWLAPALEINLLGLMVFVLLLPVVVMLVAYAWHWLGLAFSLPETGGWQALLLMPFIALAALISLELGPLIETVLFDGSFSSWLTRDLGVVYDQRNALVVGIAMGFAIIPTIFSIAEDAIFGVPRHLTMGALALGAKPWQVFWGVVMPCASPAVFSALVIGFGRAVGETMIVLMATGNTPIMDFNLFEGMRTLAANLAVEAPEVSVGSSHYRVLMLTGLILFGFTFVVNTVAEVVRQRLRERFGSL